MKTTKSNLVTIELQPYDIQTNGGRGLHLNYNYRETPFGEILIASTDNGVCYLAFSIKRDIAFAELKELYPLAEYTMKSDEYQEQACMALSMNSERSVKLCLTGTRFQIAVWNELLKIPVGELTTYGAIAQALDRPKAFRAVGSAVGANPVAILIPCHRVVRSTGALGGYHWGLPLKEKLIKWEANL